MGTAWELEPVRHLCPTCGLDMKLGRGMCDRCVAEFERLREGRALGDRSATGVERRWGLSRLEWWCVAWVAVAVYVQWWAGGGV